MKKYFTTALLACALLCGVPVLADSHEPSGNLADGWRRYVKPGMTEEFEAAFKKHLKFRKSKGDARTWNVYTPVIGDHLGYYAVRACCMNWADFDSYAKWGEDNEISDHWNANVNQYVEKYKHHLYELDFANSNWPEDDSKVSLVGVTRFYQKPGQAGQMTNAKKKMSTIAKEGGWGRHWSWSDVVGGKSVLLLASPFENFAGMEPPEQGFMAFMAEKLGSEDDAMNLMGEFSEGYAYSTYTVYRHRKDLSMTEK